MVQFFRRGELIKTHPRKERGKQTDYGDYPPEKIAFHQRTPTWCRRRAAEVGPACEAVIGELLAENALFRLRAAQGVLGLADKHDLARLEAACAKATAAGDPSYRTVKGILAAGTETTATARPTGDAGAPAHLHGPDQLFADPLTLFDASSDVPSSDVPSSDVPSSDVPSSDVPSGGTDLVADVISLATAHRVLAAHPSTALPAAISDIPLTSSEDAS